MGITNTGIQRWGYMLQGQTITNPTYLTYSSGSSDFVGTETSISNEIIRLPLTWTNTGIYSQFTTELNSLEANGSILNSLGLVDSVTIGSGNIWMYDLSYTGSKNNSFNVQVEGEVIMRRPTTTL